MTKISREKLIQDIRQLNDILEDAHPDPYINGGGKIAYHRRLQELIQQLPVGGLTKEEFFFHINPFIAKLEDAHTRLLIDKELQDKENPGGIPLYFIPIEEILIVSAVVQKEDLQLIGAKLVAVEGIAFIALIDRMKNLRGFDNLSNLLGHLGRFGMLYYQNSLRKLIPEWSNDSNITITLALSDGSEKELQMKPIAGIQYPLLTNANATSLPNSDKSLTYNFLDTTKKIACLKIDDMITFREAHELFLEIGLTEFHEVLRKVYKKYNEGELPEELPELIKGLPAATEIFTSLFKDMKKSSTEYFIVDVSNCRGGQDYIILFLLYFIIGFEKAVKLIQGRSDVLKLSRTLADSVKDGLDLEKIDYYKQVPLIIGDYYFGNDKTFSLCKDDTKQKDGYSNSMKQMPSFHKEFSKREFESYYTPKKIIVLSSDITHSSGFDLMLNLKHIGAVTVGVPSGQSGNCFGNIRQYELQHSKIKGQVATRLFIAFPDQPITHLTLKSDFELTYDLAFKYYFDKQSTLLYTLDLIEEKKI